MPLWYSAAGVLANCGKSSSGSVTLRKSPVAMNDASMTWFLALFAPFRLQLRPPSGSAMPEISNGAPVFGSMPPPADF